MNIIIDTEKIVRNAVTNFQKRFPTVKQKYPLKDMVIVPGGGLGTVIGFKGDTKRLVKLESGKAVTVDINSLKERCK